jgi:predicted adenylyl cyclase CyaB
MFVEALKWPTILMRCRARTSLSSAARCRANSSEFIYTEKVFMARNVEIKARVQDLEGLAAIAARFADEGPVRIVQDDTFFACPNGRLKLRAFRDGAGELIFYQRADQAGPKESFYVRSPTSAPDSLREALHLAYGTVGRVVKDRILFIAGRTRIHLDDVRGLGTFAELEVVLRDGEEAEDGIAEAMQVMTRLSIRQAELVEVAYVDLLNHFDGIRFIATPEGS